MRSRDLRICFFLIGLMTLLTARPVHAVDDLDRLLVINGLAENMTLIDRAGDSVVSNVLTLGLAPNRMRETANELLLTNSISDDLWVIDKLNYAVIRTINFPDGDNPYDVLVINDTLCAVSLTLANAVMMVNYISGDTLSRIDVGVSPQGLLRSGSELWVANTGLDYGTFLYGPGSVTVLDYGSESSIATVPVGTNPQVIARAADGTMHVLCTGNYFDQFGVVYIVDAAAHAVVDSIPLGGSPGDLCFGREGIAYVAAGGWVDSGEVYRYNALSRTVINGAANPWHSARGVVGVAPRLEGGVFAYCFDADRVIAHDSGGTIVESYQTGDGPQPGVHLSNRLPGDFDEDGAPTALDLNALIDLLFFGGPYPERPSSVDLNHDCIHDALDLNLLIGELFFGAYDVYWGCAP